jgi:hypothetical protein
MITPGTFRSGALLRPLAVLTTPISWVGVAGPGAGRQHARLGALASGRTPIVPDAYECPECGNTDTEWVPKGWPGAERMASPRGTYLGPLPDREISSL